MEIGRRIYFDTKTGDVLIDCGERWGSVTYTPPFDDLTTYTKLSERFPSSFDFIELPFRAYEQDFRECIGYRVNLVTRELEFSYPDPDQESIYQQPLSKEIAQLKLQVEVTQEALDFLLMGGM